MRTRSLARSMASRDVLVNNAGVGYMKPLLELSSDEWHTMVNVNFNALFHVTRAVLPGMVERGRGHIVMVGSIAGRSAFVGGSLLRRDEARRDGLQRITHARGARQGRESERREPRVRRDELFRGVNATRAGC